MCWPELEPGGLMEDIRPGVVVDGLREAAQRARRGPGVRVVAHQERPRGRHAIWEDSRAAGRRVVELVAFQAQRVRVVHVGALALLCQFAGRRDGVASGAMLTCLGGLTGCGDDDNSGYVATGERAEVRDVIWSAMPRTLVFQRSALSCD